MHGALVAKWSIREMPGVIQRGNIRGCGEWPELDVLTVMELQNWEMPHNQVTLSSVGEHLEGGVEHGTTRGEERIKVEPFVGLARIAALWSTNEGWHLAMKGEMASIRHAPPEYMTNR
jgi:hypothetical protein